jgi:hypothetical protein
MLLCLFCSSVLSSSSLERFISHLSSLSPSQPAVDSAHLPESCVSMMCSPQTLPPPQRRGESFPAALSRPPFSSFRQSLRLPHPFLLVTPSPRISTNMGKKEKSTKKSNENEDIKKGQKLQAILLAVSFTKYFRPISYIKPKVLVPLVNVPMLMYTIEFLAQNGIEEIFIFCVRHVEMIQQFVDQLSLPSNISVRCIFSRSCLSQGDALRELDVMGVVRSDPFVLINGDVISNMDLKKAIAFHKEKRQQDGNCIMTVVLKQIQKNAGIRSLSQDLVIAQDRHTQQLLLFDNEISKTNVKIPLEVLEAHPGLRLRTDLLDCQIDICSPELLLQFSDNFDYQVCPLPFLSCFLCFPHRPPLCSLSSLSPSLSLTLRTSASTSSGMKLSIGNLANTSIPMSSRSPPSLSMTPLLLLRVSPLPPSALERVRCSNL